jgi:hypothetical protein
MLKKLAQVRANLKWVWLFTNQLPSIPNVFLIPFDPVLAQQRTQFILKSAQQTRFECPNGALADSPRLPR